jgi:hypothetical protein
MMCKQYVQSTDRAKTGDELMYSGRISSSDLTCGTCRITHVTNPLISHQYGKGQIMITKNGT